MSDWGIYNKNGDAIRCRVKSLEYHDSFMGECFVTVTIKSPSPINFEIGDYLIYREEKFVINYDPTELKRSSKSSKEDAFLYENVKLNSLSDELTRCSFLDYVPYDNQIHYTCLPKFSFYAASISSLAERIQVNLDRVYTNDEKWTVEVHPEYVEKKDVNISADNINVWEALALSNSEFGANFIIRGRHIVIGTSGIPMEHLFEYGKGKGLTSIQKTTESEQNIITRIHVYGSSRNMPPRYYNKLSDGVPNNMAINFLMLPDFPEKTLDPYIDSPNIGVLGVREGSIFFDGTGDLEEIYPSIEGMTAEDLKSAGINVSSIGALDEVVDAEQITDDGALDDLENGDEVPPFTITLKDIGFNINDYLSEDTATISMRSGMCTGREFEIVSCEKKGDVYVLTCNRVFDDGLKLYFPYNSYNIKSGDKFVLLGINMPDVYIKSASQRLLTSGKEYLSKHDYARYYYEPKIDNIYMARQHDESVKNGQKSIHDTIKAGDLMLFSDNDLLIDGSIIIDSLTIKEGEGYIPTYEITLRNEKVVGSIEKMQNQIDSILSGGQGTGGYNSSQIKSLIKAFGNSLFLRKDIPDVAKFQIKFLEGILLGKYTSGILGAGGCFSIDRETGESYVEADRMLIRKTATFMELLVQTLKHIGGQLIISPASCVIRDVKERGFDEVEKERQATDEEGNLLFDEEGNPVMEKYIEMVDNGIPEDVYRCYFETSDGNISIYNEFKTEDQARCQTFNIKSGVSTNARNRYWWRLVTGIGEDYIDISKLDCDAGSDIPAAGDHVSQLGNRTDKTRQNAQILSAYGDDAPSWKMYNDIDSYSLEGKAKTWFSSKGNQVTGDFVSAATGKKFDDMASAVEGLGIDVEAIKKQTDKQYIIWFGEEVPTLLNYPVADWEEADYPSHVEDIFYLDNEADEENNGRAWRFKVSEVGDYYWSEITDRYVLQALKLANGAKKEAQTKKRIFVSQPTDDMVYDIGDLWTNAYYKNADGSYLYEDDTLVCKTSKTAGAPFNITHWKPASYATKANIVNTGDAIRLEVQANIDAVNDSISSLEVAVNSINAVTQKISFDDAGNITNIDKSGLLLEDDFASLLAQKVSFDSSGNITNIDKSGLVLESEFASLFIEKVNEDTTIAERAGLMLEKDFASMFVSAVDENGIVKQAQISAFVTMDDVNAAISNIEFSADQINFIGKTIINGNFEVDLEGNLTLNNVKANNITASGKVNAGNGSKIGGLTVSDGILHGVAGIQQRFIGISDASTFPGEGADAIPNAVINGVKGYTYSYGIECANAARTVYLPEGGTIGSGAELVILNSMAGSWSSQSFARYNLTIAKTNDTNVIQSDLFYNGNEVDSISVSPNRGVKIICFSYSDPAALVGAKYYTKYIATDY